MQKGTVDLKCGVNLLQENNEADLESMKEF